jgi:hypothetical protein
MQTLFFALLAAAPLSAQQPASDAVPRELALALIDRYGPVEQKAELFVGRAPPAFPANALPANATVLGGVERGPGANVVAAFQASPDTTLALLVRHLARGRWQHGAREQMQGFVPAESDRPQVFCRDDVSMTLIVRERSGGGSLAHLGSWKSPDDYRCGESGRRDRRGFDRVELPALRAPSGARMLGAGMGSGGRESSEGFARVETSMHSIDLAAHYARQLAEAGWTMSGPTVGEGIVVYGARRRDEQDRALGGVLFVVDIPGTQQRDVVFRAVRGEPRP